MTVRFLMETACPSARAEEPGLVAAWRLQTEPDGVLFVTDDEGRLVGAVREPPDRVRQSATVAAVMHPVDALPTLSPRDDHEELVRTFAHHPEWELMPVVDDARRLVGIVRRRALEPYLKPVGAAPTPLEPLWRALPEAVFTGVIVIDSTGTVRFLNRHGAELLGVAADRVVGRPYEVVAAAIFPHVEAYLAESAIPRVLLGLEASQGEREVTVQNGRRLLFKFAAVREAGELAGILVTFMDVSPIRAAEAAALAYADELEKAFALTLPNSKVETKLKSSPEYQDVYDPETGRAVVTGVIPDGTYRHVVNGLRLLAELNALGVFQLVGLDKDTLVQAFIFHDVGKEQPVLEVGQSFVPRETFEPSHLHAHRSADWARKYYGVAPDVEALIRHHHTPEAELPSDFPDALRPMLRIFKLVDGLSAGLTRRSARHDPFVLDASRLEVREHNVDPRYNRAYRLWIYSGREDPLDAGR
jgi:PAS domain S-box-containing protein